MEQTDTKEVLKILTQFLPTEIVTITFTKSNGEERKMNCTLNPSLIKDTYEKKTERTKKQNEEVMSVWDCDKHAWRSFRLDSIKRFEMTIK